MEPDAPFVGPDRVVVLDAPTALDTDAAVVVFPTDPERDDPVRLRHASENLLAVIGFLVLDEVEDVLGHLLDGLAEFRLARIAAFDALNECGEVYMIGRCHRIAPLSS